MVKNILGIVTRMKIQGSNKWFYIELPKKTLVRRLAQIAEDVDGTPANEWKVKDFESGDILPKGQTLNQQMASYSHNDTDLTIRIVDEA